MHVSLGPNGLNLFDLDLPELVFVVLLLSGHFWEALADRSRLPAYPLSFFLINLVEFPRTPWMDIYAQSESEWLLLH